ncbi:MAG TPA: hypothetical protein VN038_21255 [Dyadobacter sp.]|nr:hypothetical protein [Dyadobacter sp.]
MEQTTPTNAPDTAEVPTPEKLPEKLTFPILIARMMQTHRDIEAYERGEMTLEELHALGVRLG